MLKRALQVLVLALVLGLAPLVALKGTSYASGTVNWTGHGVTDGSLDTVQCDENSTPYLLWVFTLGGGTNTVTSATLSLGGSGSGSFGMTQNGNEMKATTGFFDLGTLSASVSYVGDLGNGTANLNISHGCPGSNVRPVLDCDNDFDNSPASECTTTTGGQGGGQVLGASTTAAVSVTPHGGVNAGAGGGSALSVNSL